MASRGKNNKNNKNYNDIIEEEQKKNNFIETKKIEKIINDFNYDINKNEKLNNGDKQNL